jgi:hypothetical protein
MAKEAIIIQLSDAALDELQRCTSREARGQKLLELIDTKIEDLESWFRANMGEGLVKFERAAIRTFLYREITGELSGRGDITNLPQSQVPEPSHVSG